MTTQKNTHLNIPFNDRYLMISNTMKKVFVIMLKIFLSKSLAFSQILVPQLELRIDPSSVQSVLASQVLQEVNYIPLETTKESIFGTIKRMFVTDSYFVIHDSDTKCILIFTKAGKFKSKIRLNTTSVFNIAVERAKETIRFTQDGKAMLYDFTGKLIDSYPEKIFGSSLHLFSENKIAFSSYDVDEKINKDIVDHELFIADNYKVYNSYFPFNRKLSPIQNGDRLINSLSAFYANGSDTSVNYCRIYGYDIYRLSTNRLTISFRFVFPSDITLPESFYSDSTLKNKRTDFLVNHPSIVYGISHPYQIGSNLFFRTNQWYAPVDSYLLNLNSNNLIALKYIKPDKLSYFLPVTDLNDGLQFKNKNFHTSDGNSVYTSLPSALLFKYYNSAVESGIEYSDVLKVYFKKGSRKDNPVIVQLRPKERF